MTSFTWWLLALVLTGWNAASQVHGLANFEQPELPGRIIDAVASW